jgi:hydrogenase maturation protease
VLVDAMSSGAAPGTIARFDANAERLVETLRCSASTHALSLADTLELARTLGALPSRVTVYAVEGQDFRAGDEVTTAVRAALPKVTDAVLQEAWRLCDARGR